MTTNEFTRGRIKTFDATEARRTRRRNVSLAPKEARENVPVTPVAEMPVVEPTPVSTPAVPSSAALAPAPAAATAPTTPVVSRDELQTYLINFVVEQTGYPEDMVELDADLEGDLGIDSIKKAQLLGELNEMFHFSSGEEQAQGTMSLDDFPTLHAILDYMAQKLTANDAAPEPVVTSPAPSAAPTAPATSATATPAVSRDELQAYLINFVVEQTGYPEDMVELDADLEGDLGIDSIKKAQLLGELNEMFHFSSGEEQAQGTMSLDDFPTLHAILDYMVQKLAANDAAPEPVVTSPASSAAPTAPATPTTSATQATQATPAPATPAVSRDELQAYLINFVVEQTGYPEDMVELDADLEGDLGIDSIKKAQLLGELNEMFHFSSGEEQAQGTMSLDDFPTLHAILDYMVQKLAANDASTPVTTASQPAAAVSPTSGTDASQFSAAEIQELLLQFVAEQTGFPYEMIDLDAHLEQELGIDSIKKAQLFGLLSEQFGLCPLVSASLGDFDTLRQILQASLESQS